jgi:hypothetical protein
MEMKRDNFECGDESQKMWAEVDVTEHEAGVKTDREQF